MINEKEKFKVIHIDKNANVVVCDTMIGGLIDKDVIPQALEELENSKFSAMILAYINGVSIMIEKGMSVEQVVQIWEQKKESLNNQKKKKVEPIPDWYYMIEDYKAKQDFKLVYVDKETNLAVYDARTSGDIRQKIIPNAIKLLKDTNYPAIILQSLNGVSIMIEKGMTAEQAVQMWEQLSNQRNNSRKSNYEFSDWTNLLSKYRKEKNAKAQNSQK